MTERNARQLMTLTSGMSTFTAIVAIFLGLRGSQGLALVFLLFAITGSIMSWIIYRRYIALRRQRWNLELSEAEEDLTETLTSDGRPVQPPATARRSLPTGHSANSSSSSSNGAGE